MYLHAEELQAAVHDYFTNGVNTKKVVVGKGGDKEVVEIPIPTITGLSLHCGFCSRNAFYELEKKPEFSDTVKKARSFIEIEYEQMLHSGQCTGAIFALKNMGWADTQNINHGGEIEVKEENSLMETARKLAFFLRSAEEQNK